MPQVAWRALLVGGAAALAASLLLSTAFQSPAAALAGIAVGAAVAGWLAPGASAFHGGLVAVLAVAAEALAEPFRPTPADVVSDLAATILLDVLRLAVGVLFGWLGGRVRR